MLIRNNGDGLSSPIVAGEHQRSKALATTIAVCSHMHNPRTGEGE